MNYNAFYWFALSALLNLFGLAVGNILFGPKGKGGGARALILSLCAVLALLSPVPVLVGVGALPVLLTVLLSFALVVWTMSARSGKKQLFILLSALLLFVWITVSEYALLPLLCLSMSWQWEFAFSLAAQALVLTLCAALIRLRRSRILQLLANCRARPDYILIIAFYVGALFCFSAWVLDRTGFYFSLGQFTGYISHQAGRAHYVIVLAGSAVMTALLAVVLFLLGRIEKVNRANAEASVFKARNETLMESYIEVQKYYHNMKHHFETIQYLAETGGSAEIIPYMQELMNQRSGLFQSVNSGNVYVDAVISSKIRRAEELGISVTTDVQYPKTSRIAPVDLCSVIANLLDNAIESCDAQHKNKSVDIVALTRGSYLVVKISNTVDANPLVSNPALNTTKPNQGSHGFGLQSVESILQKYDGVISYRYDKPYFTVTVTMVYE